MINLQMQGYSAALGSSGWKDWVQPAVLRTRCACCDDYLHLSDEEVLADFEVLDPREADVEEWVFAQVAEIQRTMPHGTDLVLIRWVDETESLVALPADNTGPSPAVLMAAYWNGYSTGYVARYLDATYGAA